MSDRNRAAMKRRVLCAALAAAACLVRPTAPAAQDFVEGETPNYSETIVNKLNGIVTVPNKDLVVKEGLFGVTGIRNKGVPLLDDAAFKTRMSKFLGKPLTQASRVAILNEIVYYFREKGRPFVDVSVLPQDITDGVLQVLVLQAQVGEVRVLGNKWFSSKSVAGGVHTKPGEALDVNQIAQDLDWLNRNPFRQVDLVYVKGAEFGTANLLLREVDRFPLRAYAGFDDTGTKVTQNERLSAGVGWGNVFGQDGTLDYQFLTSPNLKSFRAHSVSFSQPLPWRHIFTVFGSYADIKAQLPPPFDLSGYSWQTSARYEVPLKGTTEFKHSANLGFDYKRFNNNLTFGGLSVFATTTDVAQWSLGYNARLKDPLGETTARVTGFLSPGGWGAKSSNSAYEAARADSRAKYVYGKFELNRTTKLPWECSLVNLVTLQYSDANLLSSEQIGFGGYDTIRGYDTRVFNADNGYIVSTELRSPSWKAFSAKGDWEKFGDRWQLVAFVDYGAGSNHLRLPGERAESKLLGVGPGLRYNVLSYLSLRLDYGWQLLNEAEAARPYASRSYLGLVARY